MNKLAMYRDTHALLASTPEASAIPALSAKTAALASKLGEFAELAITQSGILTGKVAGREDVLEQAITTTLAIAGPALSYANAHGQRELAARLKLSRNDFATVRLEVHMLLAQQVHDALVPRVGALADYGITPEALADLQAKIDAGAEAVRSPRCAHVTRMAATRWLAGLVQEIDALLAGEIDPLVRPLRQTDRDFDARYAASRRVEYRPGPRGTGEDEAPVAVPVASTAVTAVAPTPQPHVLAA